MRSHFRQTKIVITPVFLSWRRALLWALIQMVCLLAAAGLAAGEEASPVTGPSGQVVVTLSAATVTLPGPEIRLGEIATFTLSAKSAGEGNHPLLAALRELVVGKLAWPGEIQITLHAQILPRLRQARREGKPLDERLIVWQGPESVKVIVTGKAETEEPAGGAAAVNGAKAEPDTGAAGAEGKASSAAGVQVGERVEIIARVGTLTVSAQGLARGGGKVGDLVPVLNLASQREVVGRVEAGGRVVVLEVAEGD